MIIVNQVEWANFNMFSIVILFDAILFLVLRLAIKLRDKTNGFVDWF